jgi:signal transduction histidine kinase
MVKRWTLGGRITALCVLAALVLGVIAVSAAVTAETNRSQVTGLLDRIGPLRTDVAQLLTVVVDQETGVRGFALTRTDDFLAPYRDGTSEEVRLIDQMRGLARDTKINRQLTIIQAQTTAWRAQIAEPTLVAARAGAPADLLPILSTGAKNRFDQIRASITDLQNDVADLRDTAAHDIRHSASQVLSLLVLAAIVVVLAGVLLALLMARLVTRPVVELAGEVRRVARGEYDLEIDVTGPPEVARLSGDINAMRQQIVADLATVRRARLQLEEANRLLERQAEELTRSNRDLEQFAYVASHDLQEPLRKVASFCQLLQRRYAGQLDERADQYIMFAVDGAQRMQRLINDLLAFSRIGRITNGFTEVDLDQVLTEVAAQLNWRREQVGGEITWSNLPTVRGEEPLLSALFTNLISNSLKFRHPDRPPRVHLAAERVGDEWQISCSDNGIGIEPEYADKIFVIFQRLHPKDEYPGTGIGLAIVKKIIEYHNGRVWLDRDDREGALIRFTLPVTAADAAATAAPPAEPTAEPTAESTVGSPTVPTAGPADESTGQPQQTEPAPTAPPFLITAAADATSAEENAS